MSRQLGVDEVTHLTQWSDFNLPLIYQRNPRKTSESVNLKAAGYRQTEGKKAVQFKEGDDLCAGRSAGAHFKGGSDTTSSQKNLPYFVPKNDWPANLPDLNPVENISSIMNEKTYKDPAPKTLDELRRRLRFAWKYVTLDTLKELAHSFYTLPLRKCQKKWRRPFWLLIFYLFNVKWIRNNILNFPKSSFSNYWNLSEKKKNRNELLKHPVVLNQQFLDFHYLNIRYEKW